MSSRPLPAATAVAALALAASLLLSGCSLLPRIPTFNNDGSSNDGSGDSIEDNPFLDHDIPDGFPADVPLPDLDILFSLTVSDTSWSIQYKANDHEADFAAVVAQFEAAGWEVMMNNQAADGSLGVFSKDPYQVQVFSLPAGSGEGNDEYDGPVMSFTVVASE